VRETGRGTVWPFWAETRQTYHVEGVLNDRGKRMGEWYLERMTLKVGHVISDFFVADVNDKTVTRL